MARSLRHLTKRRLSAAETNEIFLRFQAMDDRACAIVVGAMLDHSLERLLLIRMKPLSKDAQERLLYGTGPLSSFSGKIQIALAFGVIDPVTGDDLNIIRDIRNVFGHASHGVTFRNASIRRRLGQLHALTVVNILLRSFHNRAIRHFDSTRGRFILAGLGYVRLFDGERIAGEMKKLRNAQSSKDISLVE
jgi:DNA-binding MltR family transcriptional regulator